MEKVFQLNGLTKSAASTGAEEASFVRLKRQHLWISAELAENAFAGDRQVYSVYYDNIGMLLLAPMSDDMFKQAHECSLLMLKDRNLQGDKSLSMQEIILDNDLDDHDRDLIYNAAPGLKMLQVKLK